MKNSDIEFYEDLNLIYASKVKVVDKLIDMGILEPKYLLKLVRKVRKLTSTNDKIFQEYMLALGLKGLLELFKIDDKIGIISKYFKVEKDRIIIDRELDKKVRKILSIILSNKELFEGIYKQYKIIFNKVGIRKRSEMIDTLASGLAFNVFSKVFRDELRKKYPNIDVSYIALFVLFIIYDMETGIIRKVREKLEKLL